MTVYAKLGAEFEMSFQKAPYPFDFGTHSLSRLMNAICKQPLNGLASETDHYKYLTMEPIKPNIIKNKF